MSLFRKKSIDKIVQDAAAGMTDGHSANGLKKELGVKDLTFMGIAAVVGAGIFSTIGTAAFHGGPGISLLFVITAVTCGFSALCYAEFASRVPIAGSAYTYAYVTFGELIAWIIGWALIMEYAIGNIYVAFSWSGYVVHLLDQVGWILPRWLVTDYSTASEMFKTIGNQISVGLSSSEYDHLWKSAELSQYSQADRMAYEAFAFAPVIAGLHIVFDAPALLINILITALVFRGVQESRNASNIMVVLKLVAIVLVIAVGVAYIDVKNYQPFMPEGFQGVMQGVSALFFTYIGFDAVSTAAQEAKNPKRDMPIGILGSLVVCTILYILFGHVLTGVANWKDFVDPEKGREASVAYAISTYMIGYSWLAQAVTIAILAGFSSVILVMLMGQSRIFYTMSNDGLIPKAFGELHPKFKTPYKANWILFFFVGAFAAFVPGHVAGDLTSFGTLFAFVLVSIGVWILRVKAPNIERPFKTPAAPVVGTLGALICTAMIAGLDKQTLTVAFIWMGIGLVVYFLYSKHNSKLRNPSDIIPKASDFE